VQVIEKRVNEGEAGAGLQLSPNASHILLRWGLGPALAATAVAPTGLSIRRWGEPRAYASMPFANGSDGAPFWVARRSDLHDALKQAVMRLPKVSYKEGMALERITQNSNGLTLRLNGKDDHLDLEAQCLIGADGHRSTVRRLLGDARNLDEPGWEAWRTLIPADKTLDFIRAAKTNLWLGRDAHAVHYPVAAGKLINLVLIRRSSDRGEGWARTGDAKALGPTLATAASTLRDLASLAPDWSVWTLRDRAPSPFLAKGTAALVGDAAHPVLPFLAQGAALAIEDAEVLAAAFPDPDKLSPATITAGLRRYADARARRVTQVFKAARSNAFTYHLSGPMAWFRDRRMDQLGPEGMRRRYDWLYDWRSATGPLNR
jgi:salicylate hydroxylase